MSDTAIRASNLSKRYRIGLQKARYRTLRESITEKFSGISRKEQVEKEYFWALRDVEFEVKKGESLGIIGRNGAGKSTLLKILSRITRPTKGRAVLEGRIGSLLEVGTGFHPELTGRENVYMNGAILGMRRTEIERKFDEIVAFSEVEQFLDTPVKRYSSGMYVRLAFAVAAHLEPEILMVDEVLSVGDAEFQKKCLGKMSDVANEGRTVLFVSHNMGALKTLCTKSLLLDNGTIQMVDETSKVIEYYLNIRSLSTNATVELPDSVRLGKTIGRGLSLTIEDVAGKKRNAFKIGEKWVVRLEFEIYRKIKNCVASLGLTTVESISLITYWSKPADLDKGRYYVDFECDLPLKAAHLVMDVTLSEREMLFYIVRGKGSIEISPVSDGEQPYRVAGSGLLLGNQNGVIHQF